MAYMRKDTRNVKGSQVGQWQSPTSNGKPALPKSIVVESFSPVPKWEMKFCYSVGSVQWKKVIDCKKYMFMYPNVLKWNDSAVKEAFDNAKNRFWAELNGFPCNIPLPDPNIYIDDVDWNAPVDNELYLDLDKEAESLCVMEEKVEEPVILDRSLLLNKSFSIPGWPEPTGWGDDEVTKPPEATKTEGPFFLNSSFLLNWSFTGWGDEGVTKPSEPNYAACGWESNRHENYETNSWEQQYHVPVDQHAKDYGWWRTGQNDYRGWNPGWNQREQYGGNLHNKYQGRNARNGNRATWNGYNRKKENNRENNMSWSKKPGFHHGANDYQTKNLVYHHSANDYQTNGGRKRNGGRGGGGGRRANFGYADKVAPSGRW
ncbi:hypothetical protein P8452_61564 [Trifolium repens]|nr:hypothetical protein P8452_61564 [Trifolium repens]